MAMYQGYGGYPQFNPSYQNYQQYQPQQAHEQNSGGLIWVQGEAGAKSYLVAPGSTVLLMDSEGSSFYLKSVDGSGMPSLRRFKYTEVSQNVQQNQLVTERSQSITAEEYKDVLRRISALEEALKKEDAHE